MLLARILPAVLGLVAFLATAAVWALDVVLAKGLWTTSSPARIAAVVASILEGCVLILLTLLLASTVRRSSEHGRRRSSSILFALSLFASILASAASIVLLVLMGKAEGLPETIFQIPSQRFLIGSAVALGFAFAGQLIFVVVHFVFHRSPGSDQALSLHTNDEGRRTPQMRVKSIAYTQTRAAVYQSRMKEPFSMDYQTPPGSSSGRSAAETMSSFRSSLSHAVRPMGSKTRLLSSSSRSVRRPTSFDSHSFRDHSSITEDGFDSWDTSTVDPHHRQTVLETSPPMSSRFLETIPASPSTSRSGSPGFPLDLEAPTRSRSSRSFSPVPSARPLTPQSSTEEMSIHPLFRSDSSTPPPAASPNTMVMAAPNAGQVITARSLNRMRSGSLPSAPSPLSRQASNDTFRKASSPIQESLCPEDVTEQLERKMTPPIPAWILSAGSRTSLTEYESRKIRDRETTPEVQTAQ